MLCEFHLNKKFTDKQKKCRFSPWGSGYILPVLSCLPELSYGASHITVWMSTKTVTLPRGHHWYDGPCRQSKLGLCPPCAIMGPLAKRSTGIVEAPSQHSLFMSLAPRVIMWLTFLPAAATQRDRPQIIKTYWIKKESTSQWHQSPFLPSFLSPNIVVIASTLEI